MNPLLTQPFDLLDLPWVPYYRELALQSSEQYLRIQ
jgi:hypothetical protein